MMEGKGGVCVLHMSACKVATELNCTVLHCTVLYCTYCTVLYCMDCTVLYSTRLYCTLLYYTTPHCNILYCTALYCTVLYCTALYCAVLYYTVLCSTDGMLHREYAAYQKRMACRLASKWQKPFSAVMALVCSHTQFPIFRM